jgi:hypothetical protein
VTSESRQRLLELVAAQAESASPDRARALEDLAASIEQRPPFIVDVMRPDPLDSPEVTHLLDAYGTDAADPERFLQALNNALRDATPYGRPRPRSGMTELADALIAGLEWLGRRTVRRWRERSRT